MDGTVVLPGRTPLSFDKVICVQKRHYSVSTVFVPYDPESCIALLQVIVDMAVCAN